MNKDRYPFIVHALRMYEEGWTKLQIQKEYQVDPKTLTYWYAKYKEVSISNPFIHYLKGSYPRFLVDNIRLISNKQQCFYCYHISYKCLQTSVSWGMRVRFSSRIIPRLLQKSQSIASVWESSVMMR